MLFFAIIVGTIIVGTIIVGTIIVGTIIVGTIIVGTIIVGTRRHGTIVRNHHRTVVRGTVVMEPSSESSVLPELLSTRVKVFGSDVNAFICVIFSAVMGVSIFYDISGCIDHVQVCVNGHIRRLVPVDGVTFMDMISLNFFFRLQE